MSDKITQGIHRLIINEYQRSLMLEECRTRHLPFLAKLSDPIPPKTAKQSRYAHSLCNALAAAVGENPEDAKKDAKAAFGVVIVSTSLVTGARNARLKSFSDYTREEMTAFCSQLEAHLDERGIKYTPCELGMTHAV